MKNQTLEQQVLALHQAGKSIREAAAILGIDKSKVQRILKSLQDTPEKSDWFLTETQAKFHDTIHETVNNTLYHSTRDTGNDTRIDAPDTHFETVFDNVSSPKIPVSTYIKPVEQPPKLYSRDELKQMLEQICFYKQEYNDFVNEMLGLHNGMAMLFAQHYRNHLPRIQRLILSAKFLAMQLEEDHEQLMVTQVLKSIQSTIEKVLSGEDPVKNEHGLLYLNDRVRGLLFWQNSLNGNFLDPA